MSRAYKIKIPIDLTNLEINKNKVKIDINMLNILDITKMSDILKKVVLNLKDESISEINQVDSLIKIKNENGVIYEIDLQTLNLSIDLSDTFNNIDIDVYEESLTNNLRNLSENETIIINKDNIQNLDDKSKELIEKQTENINTEIEKQLVSESFKARQYINRVLKDVYKQAIKEKATQMGNIKSVTESEENGEYRVKMIID